MSSVSGIVEEHVQTNESVVHLENDPNSLNMNDLGHSEEVETMTIEAMEVDVQVRYLNIKNLFIKIYLICLVYITLISECGSEQKSRGTLNTIRKFYGSK